MSAHPCKACRAEVAVGLRACPGCAQLVYGAELKRIATEAEAAKTDGNLTEALALYRRATELLPSGTVQQQTILARMEELSRAIDKRPGEKGKAGRGTKNAGKAASLGAAGLMLFKAKGLALAFLANGKLLLLGLTKLPTLLSMLVYMQWRSSSDAALWAGIVGCIYVHEVGHVAALRRYGIEASAPMFIPGFGALVRLNQYPTNAYEDARTGLAGPMWGLSAAAIAGAIGYFAASPVALHVASWSASINVFNLIPFWQLDGARGMSALSKWERLVIASVGLLTALSTHEWMPAMVGLVAAPRAFQKDAPEKGDSSMTTLFAGLIVAHAVIAMLPWKPDGATP